MQTNTGVETVIKQVLKQPVTGDAVALAQSSALDTAALLQALTSANKAATQPLLDEMRLLREQVEAQNKLLTELTRPQLEQPKPVDPLAPLKRLYRWLYRKG